MMLPDRCCDMIEAACFVHKKCTREIGGEDIVPSGALKSHERSPVHRTCVVDQHVQAAEAIGDAFDC